MKNFLSVVFILASFSPCYSQPSRFRSYANIGVHYGNSINLKSDLLNYRYGESIYYANDVEFNFLGDVNFGLVNIGVGNYFNRYTNNGNIFFVKGGMQFVTPWSRRISVGAFVDYMPTVSSVNTGANINFLLTRFRYTPRHSMDLQLSTDISYNRFFDSWESNLNLAFAMNFHDHRKQVRKPVVYLYPEDTLELTVELDFKGDFTFTYPKYDGGWDLTVSPSSEIVDNNDGKQYSYLFWEGNYATPDPDSIEEGFFVKRDDLTQFFEEKLAQLSLNPREINDFVTYWAPMLEKEEYLVHFIINENCDQIATYEFSKEPDSFLRVIALFSEAPENHDSIRPQELPTNTRDGFVAVEWGGVEL